MKRIHYVILFVVLSVGVTLANYLQGYSYWRLCIWHINKWEWYFWVYYTLGYWINTRIAIEEAKFANLTRPNGKPVWNATLTKCGEPIGLCNGEFCRDCKQRDWLSQTAPEDRYPDSYV